MTRDEYVESLKSAAVSIGKKAVMSALAKQLPKVFAGALGGVFNPIIGFIVGWILEKAVIAGEMGAFFLYIDMRVNKQLAGFEKIAHEHYKAVQSGDKKLAAKLEESLKKEFAAFARITN